MGFTRVISAPAEKQNPVQSLLDVGDFPSFQVDGDKCLDHYSDELTQSAVGLFIVFIEYILPMMILIYCYGRIVWTIRARIGTNIGGEDAQRAKFELARDNVVKTLLIVFFFFVICFLGNQVYYLCYRIGLEVNQNSVYYNFTVCMYFFNCTVNPFIYLVNYKDFQKALKKQFCCRTSRQENNLDICSSNSTIATSVEPPSTRPT